MTPGDHPHGAGIGGNRIQIKGDLDAWKAAAVVAVRMPLSVADVKVTVTAGVVEVLAEDARRDIVNPRIVQQAAQVFALIRERYNT